MSHSHLGWFFLVCNSLIFRFNNLITLQISDIISFSGHFHGINRGMSAKPRDITSRRIRTTTVIDSLLHQLCILFSVKIERGTTPVGSRCGLFFSHIQYLISFINGNHPAFQQFLIFRLIVSHNTGGPLFLCIFNKFCQAKIQHVIARDDQYIII